MLVPQRNSMERLPACALDERNRAGEQETTQPCLIPWLHGNGPFVHQHNRTR